MVSQTTEAVSDGAARPGILVVDDDPVLLNLLRAVFAAEGLEVWASLTGPGAVELYRQHRDRIGVVLLDVCMPGMDGPTTLAELRHLNPGVRACFMSGYTGGYTPEGLRAMGVARFFEKPFRIEVLGPDLSSLARGGLLQSA